MESTLLESVSRETRLRLETYVAELIRWQKAVNLVSKASLESIWTRHVADSLQLVDVMPDAATWIDLGSGGGLPGLVIAASDRLPAVTLVESDSRKCAFLRHAALTMGVNASVRAGRIEAELGQIDFIPDVVTARGLSALPQLIAYAAPILAGGSIGVFLKGNDAERELTLAHECWIFDAETIPSRTDSTGRILRVTNFRGRRA